MATICKRLNADGSIVYRIQFRRKGLPFVSRTFGTLRQAKEFELLEYDYIFNHEKYILEQEQQRELNRINEFKRRKALLKYIKN